MFVSYFYLFRLLIFAHYTEFETRNVSCAAKNKRVFFRKRTFLRTITWLGNL